MPKITFKKLGLTKLLQK